MRPHSSAGAASLIFLLSVVASAAQAPEFEVPPVLHAAAVVGQELLRGPHHRVRDIAESDGYLTHFTIDSDYGVFACAGRAELEIRVREISAISQLVEVSKGDMFAEGLRRSVEQPVAAVKNIVNKPVESVKAVPKTVGHFFGKVGSSVGNAAKRVEQRGGQSGASDGGGKQIGQAARSVAGFDQARLACARQLGVDPYSDNERLQNEIDKVSWAFFAGGMPLRIGAAAASGGASFALTATNTIGLPDEMYDLTPSELALRDRKALEGMGVGGKMCDRVFLNPAWSVTRRHALVAALKALPGGSGRRDLVGIAASCEDGAQADFFRRSLAMLSARHRVSPYASLRVFGRLPAGVTAAGGLEIGAPVDDVFWTAQVAGFATRGDFEGTGKTLLLAGKASAIAAEGFRNAGWQVVAVP